MNFSEAQTAMAAGCTVSNERFNKLWLADLGRTLRDPFGDIAETEKRGVRGLTSRDKKSNSWRIRNEVDPATGVVGEDLYDPYWPDPEADDSPVPEADDSP